MSLDFLYLSEPDMIKAGVLDMAKCVNTMDEVFQLIGQKDYLMGGPREHSHGIMLYFPKEKRTEKMPVAGPDRRFMSMPAYLGGRFYVCGQKWYGSNIANIQKGLPRSILTVMLNDVDTGAPLALMSANLISSMRTGAIPGVATKYLQHSGASVVGIVGAGVISRACLLSISETIRTKGEVRVYDILPEKSDAFVKEMSELTGMKVRAVPTLADAVAGCDIVSVAASGKKPVEIKDEWIQEGALVALSGVARLSESCYINNKVVLDNKWMHKEWLDELLGDLSHLSNVGAGHTSTELFMLINDGKIPFERVGDLGEIAARPETGRRNDSEKIIFISGGLPLEDLAWGYDVYQEALRQGIGQKLNLWDKPHWA